MFTVRMWYSLLLCIISLLAIPSQSFSARVVSLVTCERVAQPGMKADGVKSQFYMDAPEIHVLVKLDGLKAGSKLKCSWISVDAIQIPNHEITSSEAVIEKDGEATLHFSLSRPTNGWPAGTYKVDIYLDQALIKSSGFSILAKSSSAPLSIQPYSNFSCKDAIKVASSASYGNAD